jgi:spore coat polysaccharide biosynthesis protein SpsF
MKVLAVIQARMSSTRLPGKCLLPLAGRPMLEHVLHRVHQIKGIDQIWVATTDDGSEAPLAELCERLKVRCYRGSVEDVLSRYAAIARQEKADAIVRITADCPFLDPEVSGRVLQAYREAAPRYAYVSNTLRRTFPRGLDTEVLSAAALERAHREAIDPQDREHVSRFLYTHSDWFPNTNVADAPSHSDLRWTVDTPADYTFAQRIYDALYPNKPDFGYPDILALLERQPELSELNAHVAQKEVV